jgi:nucleobase:cation symporter-1, NCS1 family
MAGSMAHPEGGGRIERHSVEPVPNIERTSRFFDMFRMMFALNLNPLIYVLGALAVIRGELPVWYAATAIALGQLFAQLLLGMIAWAGVDYGIPGQVALRATLGHRGARGFASPYRLVVSTYLFAVQALAASYAIQALIEPMTGHQLPLVKTALVLGLVEVGIATVGFGAFKRLSKLTFPIAIAYVCTVLLLYAFRSRAGSDAFTAGSTSLQFSWVAFAAFFTAMASGALSFVTSVADLCRYSTSRRGVFLGITVGAGSATFLGAWIGAYAAAATGDLNPYVAVGELAKSRLLLGALLLALLLQAVSVSVANVYTAGFSVANIVPRLSRWACTLIAGLPAVCLTLAPSVVSHAERWMADIGVVAAPLAGVVAADLVRREFVLDVDSLLRRGPHYWYQQGVNLSAFSAVAVGAFVYSFVPESLVKAAWGVAASAFVYLAICSAGGPTFAREVAGSRWSA